MPQEIGFPIDLVYLWCDSADPAWRRRKALYDPSAPAVADDVCESRYMSNDELRYSLRSVARNLPWVRRIFIVADGQRPTWLCGGDGRISIVDHRDIIDEKYLPQYNSSAIESMIYRIPGLAEHFLYANDDMFAGCPLGPEYFFTPDGGQPIVRLKHQKLSAGRGTYQDKVRHMQELAAGMYGRRFTLAPHHNIDAYRRSLYDKYVEQFRPLVDGTLAHRFRSAADFQRSLIGYCMLAQGEAVAVKNSRYAGCGGWADRLRCLLTGRYKAGSRCIPLRCDNFDRVLRKYRPRLFALNDDSRTLPADRERVRCFMRQMFPLPSPFEKD